MLNHAATEAPIRGASLCLSSENVVAFFLLKFCKLLCNVCQLSLKGVCVCVLMAFLRVEKISILMNDMFYLTK